MRLYAAVQHAKPIKTPLFLWQEAVCTRLELPVNETYDMIMVKNGPSQCWYHKCDQGMLMSYIFTIVPRPLGPERLILCYKK